MLNQIQELSQRVGQNIFPSVIGAIAGGQRPDQIQDLSELRTVLERLQNADRGIERLKAAVREAGVEAHAATCHDLGLPGTSVDHIPNTMVLRQFVDQLEQWASSTPRTNASPRPAETDEERSNGGSGDKEADSAFADLRNQVLALSRRVATLFKRQVGDVVAWASDGKFQYGNIGKLTPADIPHLQMALKRLKEALDSQEERR